MRFISYFIAFWFAIAANADNFTGMQSRATESSRPSVIAPIFASAANDIEAFHYEVRLAPNLKERTLVGKTKIQMRAMRDGVFDLHFAKNDLSINRVQIDGGLAEFRKDSKSLIISSGRPFKKGVILEVEIAYSGLSDGVKFGDNFLYTPFNNCRWMICIEDPVPKASVTMHLTVPNDFRVVASGKLSSEHSGNDGLKTQIWIQEHPYSPYLFGFAAGHFTEFSTAVGKTKLRFLGVRETEESLNAKLKPTAEMLRFFEEKSGVPFPHDEYTQLVIPGSEAQEYSSYSIVGQTELDPILQDPQEDWVIAHELAHQWWGNLVTCKTWQHFWLNEGIVVFMVAAYKKHRWGAAAYDREIKVIRKRYQRAVDANFDVPLTYLGVFPSLQLKRSITYSKAAVFLDILFSHLGEESFWKGLKNYTQKNVGGSVESKDFQSAMENSSGKNLSQMFSQWVY